MDDEQRERMHDLKRTTWRGVLTGGAVLVFTIVAGVVLSDDWKAYLVVGSSGLALTILVFLSQWRYIRRGPFPRLPAGMRDGTSPSSGEKPADADHAGQNRTNGQEHA
ncbi:hypothetical protein ACIBCH_14995 [Amycolatopsis thailandensis]|uniref:hypothetical protein n=1 Tax=Amycolatopsis thailandensis TaxID=589330 RepID=UPI0037AC2D4F